MSEYRHITQLLTNQFEKRLLICIIWKICLFSICLHKHLNYEKKTTSNKCKILKKLKRARTSNKRCEVLDQLESTQQNRSQPGQIKAQLIILIDKRRLHAWRQISLRKIDEQFLMYVVSHFL
ncbi:hypothetical protein T12_7663 [Trichinella patagoniensis]|uniref:Uncharacterized protein n=1 Tax=Trichinella patagoniensis TaxID=990121 RepID=A0A0V1A646_9BILA|nr:hypothetical protein T12_7663 [Trichinella patagoniensis]